MRVKAATGQFNMFKHRNLLIRCQWVVDWLEHSGKRTLSEGERWIK